MTCTKRQSKSKSLSWKSPKPNSRKWKARYSPREALLLYGTPHYILQCCLNFLSTKSQFSHNSPLKISFFFSFFFFCPLCIWDGVEPTKRRRCAVRDEDLPDGQRSNFWRFNRLEQSQQQLHRCRSFRTFSPNSSFLLQTQQFLQFCSSTQHLRKSKFLTINFNIS